MDTGSTRSRSDNEIFTVDELDYLVQSGAYPTDAQGRVSSIAADQKAAVFMDVQTDESWSEFSGEPDAVNHP